MRVPVEDVQVDVDVVDQAGLFCCPKGTRESAGKKLATFSLGYSENGDTRRSGSAAGMARQLEGGHDHLAEMVQAAKNQGARALHFTAGCKMVEVCEYLLRISRWTWMSLTKQILPIL